MFETVLTIAAAVCIVDVLWMLRARRRAAATQEGMENRNPPSHAAIVRRITYYLVAMALIYSFGGWLNVV